MGKNIEEIEGIGTTIGAKLSAAGITTVESLLEKGASRQGRKELADQTGISESQLLKWVNMADLFRIKGIGSEYSELLEAAGVDTIKELRNRVPENLYAKILEVNKEKKLVRSEPSLNQIKDFIEQAKNLEPKLTY